MQHPVQSPIINHYLFTVVGSAVVLETQMFTYTTLISYFSGKSLKLVPPVALI